MLQSSDRGDVAATRPDGEGAVTLDRAALIVQNLQQLLPFRALASKCYARGFVISMALSAAGMPSSAYIVHGDLSATHPSGPFWQTTLNAEGQLVTTQETQVSWLWHQAARIRDPQGVAWIIDGGVRPEAPLLRLEEWLSLIGAGAQGELVTASYLVPGSLGMTSVANQPFGVPRSSSAAGDVERWIGHEPSSIADMPLYQRHEIDKACWELTQDFVSESDAFGESPAWIEAKQHALAAKVAQLVDELEQLGLLSGPASLEGSACWETY